MHKIINATKAALFTIEIYFIPDSKRMVADAFNLDVEISSPAVFWLLPIGGRAHASQTRIANENVIGKCKCDHPQLIYGIKFVHRKCCNRNDFFDFSLILVGRLCGGHLHFRLTYDRGMIHIGIFRNGNSCDRNLCLWAAGMGWVVFPLKSRYEFLFKFSIEIFTAIVTISIDWLINTFYYWVER